MTTDIDKQFINLIGTFDNKNEATFLPVKEYIFNMDLELFKKTMIFINTTGRIALHKEKTANLFMFMMQSGFYSDKPELKNGYRRVIANYASTANQEREMYLTWLDAIPVCEDRELYLEAKLKNDRHVYLPKRSKTTFPLGNQISKGNRVILMFEELQRVADVDTLGQFLKLLKLKNQKTFDLNKDKIRASIENNALTTLNMVIDVKKTYANDLGIYTATLKELELFNSNETPSAWMAYFIKYKPQELNTLVSERFGERIKNVITLFNNNDLLKGQFWVELELSELSKDTYEPVTNLNLGSY